MTYASYDRLTAADEAFLDLEGLATPMHVGAVCLYDLAPLRTANGGLDFARLLRHTEAALSVVPRFRQRLSTVPLFGRPVWVDDDRFNLRYHVRHTAVPRPGNARQVKRLAARILSQPLNRARPLWEMWFVEGLADERFALVVKAHHCMVDGIAGADLLAALMAVDDRDAAAAAAARWRPRPHPSALELIADEIGRRAALVPAALRAGRELYMRPRAAVRAVADVAAGLVELAGVRPVSPSPLNVPISPHRRFDWTRMDLAAMRDVGHRFGATVNDVALAIVAGALRSAWRREGRDVDGMDCRALVSVSLRAAPERGALGNRVATLLAGLPMDETDPVRRLRRVADTMRAAKASHQVLATEIIEELSDWTFASLLVGFARLAVRSHAYTIDVTNVPGPPAALALLGAELREVYALTPLVEDQALALALFSYNGAMHWGFNADWQAVPAVHDFVGTIETEFVALQRAAAQESASDAGRRGGRRRARSRSRTPPSSAPTAQATQSAPRRQRQ
jgi:WS/DGAT/MGAT family acyltransferase